jgi:hypothetical protein
MTNYSTKRLSVVEEYMQKAFAYNREVKSFCTKLGEEKK